MFAIHHNGSEEQKEEWLPRMAAGEAIGCFGLTEPDFGSNPGGMRTNAKRDGDDWILNGTKMWITNGSIADVAVVWARTDDGVRGFVVPTDTRDSPPPRSRTRCRSGVGHLGTGARGRASACLGDAAQGSRTVRPARLPQRGTLRHHLRGNGCST
ncbi:acyl-CoA dehydrogenase family protein [Rhodococcus sp. 3Y1]